MSNTNKRKPVYPRDPEPPMRNTKKDAKRLKPSQEDAKRFKPSQENSSVYLIDGIPPVQTEEAKKLAATNKESNRKKAIRKNLASELIDESYPPSICPVCNEHPENGRSGADLHFKAEHSGVKAFKCAHPSCESCFSSRPGLKYHLEHAHTVTLASSPSSQAKSKAKEALVRKNKKLALSEKLQKQLEETYSPTVCPACKEKFKKKTHVITHLAQDHHGEEPFKCIVSSCDHTKSYATRDGLLYHLVKFHD